MGKSRFARGRWSTLVFLMLSTWFAVTAMGRGAITPWVTLRASIATLFLWPFLGVFVWSRASTHSVVAAMLVGFLAIRVARFTGLGELLPFGFATAGFLAGAGTFLVAELVTRTTRLRGPAPDPRSCT